MAFYEVLVSSSRFHGSEPLTYSYDGRLEPGAVVTAPLRQETVVGVVLTEVKEPSFKVKPLARLLFDRPLPIPAIELLKWLPSYYPAPLGLVTQLFIPSTLASFKPAELEEPLPKPAGRRKLPPLSAEQNSALQQMADRPTWTVLLHGDTGTGKTRLYLELAARSLANGRSVLILTPEIGLTPQLEERVKTMLPYPVVTVHSNLTPAARRKLWLQILMSNQPLILLGPRSALFAPVSNLGLIVMDEAHDAAYKQEQAPRYQARQVASQLAQLHGAQLVLGTATPNVSDYYLAEAKKALIIRLTDQPAGIPKRHIIAVNIRDRAEFPRQPHLSKPLLTAIDQALTKQQQSLIFLNRRGTARVVLCQVCGWQALCPRCDLPLTFHADQHRLRCHTCGYQKAAPSSCPVCHSTDIVFKGSGTKALVEELQQAFPEARIQRFDNDNSATERLEKHFEALARGEVDILVGTQLLTKGLDLPKLAVVGVINADNSLNFPDYTAEERTYQLLTQVIGRVGRGHLPGTVVVQSYNPERATIQSALQADWPAFYKQQLKERETFGFPPFYHLLKLSTSRASAAGAATAARVLAGDLQTAGLRISLIGPAPSFFEKTNGRYRWQLVVKAKQRTELLKVLPLLPSGWSYDLDPADLL